MATRKQKKKPAARNPSPRRDRRPKSDHRSDAPGARELPGTGQAGDEVVPVDREAVQDLVEKAKARKGEPRQPVGQVLPRAGKADAREAEERIDHAGLEDDAADEERAATPPPGTVGA